MTHGSLFSGIGGFDLAAEWMGWDNVFHCEWNEFGQRVLHHYWPQAIQYNDITKTDFTIHRGRIDVLTGGFPCQPYSAAGKRLGKEDERHLWPEMLRAIREIQPRWVVGENVRGLVNWNGGLVFDEVQSDMEAEGYEVLPFLVPACGKDAPHRRERIWFVAYCDNRNGQEIGLQTRRQKHLDGIERKRPTSHTDSERCDNGVNNRSERPIHHDKERNSPKGKSERAERQCGVGQVCSDGPTPHADSDGQQRSNGEHEEHTSERGINAQRDFEQGDGDGVAPNANGRRQPGEEHRQTESGRITETRVRGDWQNFPTQSPVCGRDDGLSTELDGITFPKWRNESIKAYGNAVVPQVVYEIFKSIEQYDRTRL